MCVANTRNANGGIAEQRGSLTAMNMKRQCAARSLFNALVGGRTKCSGGGGGETTTHMHKAIRVLHFIITHAQEISIFTEAIIYNICLMT